MKWWVRLLPHFIVEWMAVRCGLERFRYGTWDYVRPFGPGEPKKRQRVVLIELGDLHYGGQTTSAYSRMRDEILRRMAIDSGFPAGVIQEFTPVPPAIQAEIERVLREKGG